MLSTKDKVYTGWARNFSITSLGQWRWLKASRSVAHCTWKMSSIDSGRSGTRLGAVLGWRCETGLLADDFETTVNILALQSFSQNSKGNYCPRLEFAFQAACRLENWAGNEGSVLIEWLEW